MILLFSGVFASCGDDELNSSELKVYVKTGFQNQIDLTLTHAQDGTSGQTLIEFPIRATRELYVDADATFLADEPLAESYNEVSNTNYKLLTSDLYTLTAKVTIRQGEQSSEQLVRIELTNPSALTDFDGYILPVRLEKVDSRDKGLVVSSNMNTVYIIISSKFENVSAETTAPDGELAERTGWSAETTAMYGSYIAPNMIDGDLKTVWFGYGRAALTFDMGEVQTIKGFRLTPNYVAFDPLYYITKMEIQISNDGERWVGQGDVNLSGPDVTSGLDNPDYKYIHFYNPVNVRYFRLQVLETLYGYGSLAEVEIYK